MWHRHVARWQPAISLNQF